MSGECTKWVDSLSVESYKLKIIRVLDNENIWNLCNHKKWKCESVGINQRVYSLSDCGKDFFEGVGIVESVESESIQRIKGKV